MAEGWARQLKNDVIEAFSAGIEKHGLNPYAVKVMAEAGVDISIQYSKTVDDVKNIEFDFVVTLCGHANENCPLYLKKTQIIHQGFEDPFILAQNSNSEEEKFSHYRRIRDEIKTFIESLPDSLVSNLKKNTEN